jgi:hypothetical protein
LIAVATTSQNEVLDFSEAKCPNADLVLPAGATKPLLTNQMSLVRSVVHDAIENMWALLMFNHAFPDSVLSSTFAKESLITAAEKQAKKHKPSAAVTDLQGPPSERTPEQKLWDFKTRAQQYARDRESCDDTRISYLEFLETEAEDDLALARMIAG